MMTLRCCYQKNVKKLSTKGHLNNRTKNLDQCYRCMHETRYCDGKIVSISKFKLDASGLGQDVHHK